MQTNNNVADISKLNGITMSSLIWKALELLQFLHAILNRHAHLHAHVQMEINVCVCARVEGGDKTKVWSCAKHSYIWKVHSVWFINVFSCNV
jgi:hypothetical protein